MIFEKQVPEWRNSGTEPSEGLLQSGFVGGYKPPASIFNWFFHGFSEVAKELQGSGLFAYLGDNPINIDGDTVDAWVALGSGYARYTDTGTLTDKPSKYGVLLSVCVNGKDMFQLWYVAPTGPLLHRGGNASGWNGTWKKVYDTANKPAITDILTSQLGVELGGTGAKTKKDAFKNLAFLGQNPIDSVENDTIENWVSLGSGFAWISELDRLNNQPSNYGLLINYVPNSYEVTQIWKTHSSGPMFIRSGNRNGWGQQWTKLYDTANKPTPAEIGAIPIINAESSDYDMDVIAVSGDHAALYITNQYTLGTPYKNGATTYTEALILSYGSSKSYAMQVAFVSGNQPIVRYLHDGSLSDWFNILTDAQPVTLEQGGTNADNRADAMHNISFIGENPITLQVNDTSENWVKLGTGYAWYNGSNQLLNQPSQYGMLLNYVSGVEVTQIWKCHATGPMWIRSGNKAGWGQVWTKVFDTLNPPSADNITGVVSVQKGGSGANSAAGALANFGAFRNLGKQIIASTADDTVAKWSSVDSGYSYYETKGLLIDQPTQYGILIHFHQSTEVFQIWRSQSGGPTYWRSGNSVGWASTWAKVYDTFNKPTASDVGAFSTGELIPLANGGTNRNLSEITPYAIIRAASNSTALLSTPTANGAFYATAANGAAKFGTLPIAQGGTGATTAADALANLGAVPKLVNVNKAGTDLNDYTEEGVYVFGSSYTPINIPAGSNGWLVVLGGVNNYIKQIWYRWGTPGANDHQTYVRTGAASGWGEWASYLTSRDYAIASISDSYHHIHFAKVGRLVICTILPSALSSTIIDEKTNTIPDGCRPQKNETFIYFSDTAKNKGDSTGKVQITANSNGSLYFGAQYQCTVAETSRTLCWLTA